MRNGKREAQMRTNGKREAQMRARETGNANVLLGHRNSVL